MNIYYYSTHYTDSSNGLRLAYEFVVYLRRSGFKAFNIIDGDKISGDCPKEYKDNICFSCNLVLEADDIVIYPETVFGNPLKAKRIIRFCLNRVEENIAYGNNEYFVTYNTAIYPGFPVFYCQKDETALFESLRKEKHEKLQKNRTLALYFGKARYEILDRNSELIGNLIKDYSMLKIITRNYPSNHVDTLKLVRDSDLLVSFDALTNMNYESTLLGTPVLVVDDFFKINNEIEIGHYGFAHDISQIDDARKNVDKAFYEYVSIINNQGKDFSSIIEKAVKHFERIGRDGEYARKYIEGIQEIIKKNPPCCFENINELKDIPVNIRRKMGISGDGINIKAEIKYLLLKLKIYYFIKDTHKKFTKFFSK